MVCYASCQDEKRILIIDDNPEIHEDFDGS